MNHCISNIAWHPSLNEQVARLLRDAGLTAIEIAPTTVWDQPQHASPEDIQDLRRWWERRGLEIVAFQSLLFGRDDLRLFDGEEERRELLDYLDGIVELGVRLGAQAFVFGSPKARLRDGLPIERANEIAASFFREVGERADRRGVAVCIEANPPAYGADFVVNAKEALNLVEAVDHKGFGLHLDAACMHLAGDDPLEAITAGAKRLRHFHVSEPHLAPVGDPDSSVDHSRAATALRDTAYGRYVSVEMRAVEQERQVETVREAINFLTTMYA
jgi:sugar phosphate isomerase/epimerase